MGPTIPGSARTLQYPEPNSICSVGKSRACGRAVQWYWRNVLLSLRIGKRVGVLTGSFEAREEAGRLLSYVSTETFTRVLCWRGVVYCMAFKVECYAFIDKKICQDVSVMLLKKSWNGRTLIYEMGNSHVDIPLWKDLLWHLYPLPPALLNDNNYTYTASP